MVRAHRRSTWTESASPPKSSVPSSCLLCRCSEGRSTHLNSCQRIVPNHVPPGMPIVRVISSLPEEVLREILGYALAKPLESFFTSHRSEADREQNRESVPQSNVLLVCKVWWRVGTPLLYVSTCLSTPEHTRIVAKTLKTTPRLGFAIQNLRLDAGFGPDLAPVARLARNVKSLYVNTAISAEESLGGLRRALLLLQPTTLFVHSPDKRNHNVKQTQVDALLEAMIRQQPAIVSHVPFALSSRTEVGTAVGNLLRKLLDSNPNVFIFPGPCSTPSLSRPHCERCPSTSTCCNMLM